ncbi:Retrotransposon-derived protein PEG10, partial [Ophiophagus hannah]
MDQLRADNAQLSQQVALLTAQVAQMQAARPCRKCPVAVPDKFDGPLAQFPAFFGQCQLYMSLWPEDFPTECVFVLMLGFSSDGCDDGRMEVPLKEPMQLGVARPRLTQAEKVRCHCDGLCLYCGNQGHFVAKCPVKTSTAATPVVAGNGHRLAYWGPPSSPTLPSPPPLTSSTSPPLSLLVKHLVLPASVFMPGVGAVEIQALVNSGATANFMDAHFVRAVVHSSGTGVPARPVVAATKPLCMRIGQHVEEAVFYIAAVPHFPVVLGLEWLQAHDPQIVWSSGVVQFLDRKCATHCLHSCVGSVATPVDLDLPAELVDFADVFGEKEADQLPPYRAYDCPIDLLPNVKLPVGPIYSLSEPELAALRDFTNKNLRKGFIQPSTSPLAALVLFVKKKSGELRLYCDYHKLNAITVRNQYPLPLIPELIEQLCQAKIFMKLDLRRAYNLVHIHAGDKWKTAFRMRYSHFDYTVMPFGLTNAPAVFLHFMNEHWQHVRLVLQLLCENHLFAKREKCQFAQTTIDFLGHRISPAGVEMDPEKIESLQAFVNYYRTFIPRFAALTAPLSNLLKKGEKFHWGAEEQTAFEALKVAFASEPILKHPDPGQPFVVETDTSDVAVGAVLLQAYAPPGTLFLCTYNSRKLSAPELNYMIWDKELLAIKVTFETWRHNLEGAHHQIEVRTDHRNLEHLSTAQTLNQRQVRWSLFFARFDFWVTYVPSGGNQCADALSQKPEYTRREDKILPQTVIPLERFAATEEPVDLRVRIQEAQQQEHLWQLDIENWMRMGDKRLLGCILGTCYGSVIAFMCLEVLFVALSYVNVMIVQRRDTLGCSKHCTSSLGHFASCGICRQAKYAPGAPPGLLQPLPTPERPWGTVSLDFITELPPSKGATTILVVVDMLTKMAHFIPCVGLPLAKITAQLFISHVFRLHGLPDRIVSDRGVQTCLSFTHHPETDGGTERMNAILEQYLRCFSNTQQDNWVEMLPVAEFASPSDSPLPAVDTFLQELKAVHHMVRNQLERAKEDYKWFAERHCHDVLPSALGHRKAERDGAWYHIQPVFQGSLLVPVSADSLHRPDPSQPAPVAPLGEEDCGADFSIRWHGRVMGQRTSPGLMPLMFMLLIWSRTFTLSFLNVLICLVLGEGALKRRNSQQGVGVWLQRWWRRLGKGRAS